MHLLRKDYSEQWVKPFVVTLNPKVKSEILNSRLTEPFFYFFDYGMPTVLHGNEEDDSMSFDMSQLWGSFGLFG
jgi:hypothetical protein